VAKRAQAAEPPKKPRKSRRLMFALGAWREDRSDSHVWSGRANRKGRGMSALGQKQTWRSQVVMSAIPPKADIRPRDQDVCFEPSVGIVLIFDPLLDERA
jgi:hypothetical protein